MYRRRSGWLTKYLWGPIVMQQRGKMEGIPNVPRIPLLGRLAPTVAQLASKTPVVLTGVDLTLPRASALTPHLLEAELLQLDGGVEQRASPTVLYYNRNKPLSKVKWFHDRPAQVRNMSAQSLLSKLAETSAAEAWDLANEASSSYMVSGTCAARQWLYYSAPNATNAVRLARAHLDVEALETAVMAAGKVCGRVHVCHCYPSPGEM